MPTPNSGLGRNGRPGDVPYPQGPVGPVHSPAFGIRLTSGVPRWTTCLHPDHGPDPRTAVLRRFFAHLFLPASITVHPQRPSAEEPPAHSLERSGYRRPRRRDRERHVADCPVGRRKPSWPFAVVHAGALWPSSLAMGRSATSPLWRAGRRASRRVMLRESLGVLGTFASARPKTSLSALERSRARLTLLASRPEREADVMRDEESHLAQFRLGHLPRSAGLQSVSWISARSLNSSAQTTRQRRDPACRSHGRSLAVTEHRQDRWCGGRARSGLRRSMLGHAPSRRPPSTFGEALCGAVRPFKPLRVCVERRRAAAANADTTQVPAEGSPTPSESPA